MSKISRRSFLHGAAATVGALSIAPGIVLGRKLRADRDFNMLVIGDSLIAGQGLKEEDKFYSLTRDWLEEEFFGGARAVKLTNKSHSGANIFLNEETKKALEEANKPNDEFYHQEVSFNFPSIKTQAEVASKEYSENGTPPDEVDLLMLSGGITNITVKNIIDPFAKDSKLRRDIKAYCGDMMSEFLKEAHGLYPNARILVIGYYPMVSPKSSTGMIYNTVLELYGFPGPLKPVMNNIITKQPFKILHGEMTDRSRIWAEESDRELRRAVSELNSSAGKQAAAFVKSPINELNCFGTKNSLLWKMGKKGKSMDDLYEVREEVCSEALSNFKDVELDFKTRFCELAGIGHPNVEGSIAYTESIKTVLAPLLNGEAVPAEPPANGGNNSMIKKIRGSTI